MPNQVLIGTIQYDPELRYTATGKALVSFVIETENNDFRPCFAWEALATEMAMNSETYKPGTKVRLSGYWKTRTWTDREGERQSRPEFTAKSVKVEASKECG